MNILMLRRGQNRLTSNGIENFPFHQNFDSKFGIVLIGCLLLLQSTLRGVYTVKYTL